MLEDILKDAEGLDNLIDMEELDRILNMNEEEIEEAWKEAEKELKEMKIEIPYELLDKNKEKTFFDPSSVLDNHNKFLNRGKDRKEKKISLIDIPEENENYTARFEVPDDIQRLALPIFFNFSENEVKFYSKISWVYGKELPFLKFYDSKGDLVVKESMIGWNQTEIENALSLFRITKDVFEFDSFEEILEEIMSQV